MNNNVDLTRVTLAVLAGGAGRRMGMTKGRLLIGGRPILQYILESIRWPGPTLLVTAPQCRHPPAAELFDHEAVDPVALGPLGGIRTALQNCATPYTLISTVDMPGVGREQLQWLSERLHQQPAATGLMLERQTATERQIEPFPLACTPAVLDAVERQFMGPDRSVQALRHTKGFLVETSPSHWSEKVWTNLNTPGDYQSFIEASINPSGG